MVVVLAWGWRASSHGSWLEQAICIVLRGDQVLPDPRVVPRGDKDSSALTTAISFSTSNPLSRCHLILLAQARTTAMKEAAGASSPSPRSRSQIPTVARRLVCPQQHPGSPDPGGVWICVAWVSDLACLQLRVTCGRQCLFLLGDGHCWCSSAVMLLRCHWDVVDETVPFDNANFGSMSPCMPRAWVFGDRVSHPSCRLFGRCHRARLLLSVRRAWHRHVGSLGPVPRPDTTVDCSRGGPWVLGDSSLVLKQDFPPSTISLHHDVRHPDCWDHGCGLHPSTLGENLFFTRT